MRGPGQIAALARLARPAVGVITNVGEAHVELLGSRAAIAAAKAELLEALPAGGVAVVPDAEPLLDGYSRADVDRRSFGETDAADVRIVERRTLEEGSALALHVRGRPLRLRTNLVGAHHARNIAAAIAVCDALGLDLEGCAQAASQIALQRWRSEELPLPGGGLIVNDAYNANPSSVEAALAALAERRRPGRLVAVLGAMAELGAEGPALHRRVGAAAAELGYDVLVAVGAGAAPYLDDLPTAVERHLRADRDGLEAFVAGLLQPGDRVLVKGSRAAALEHVATGVAAAAAKGVR
jgi:UDP-N-acetylmuramoyl-tripeptide--D-alanyl-D-alanine ligase